MCRWIFYIKNKEVLVDVSKLKALFAQMDTNKNNSISDIEMKDSSYKTVFDGYFKGGAEVNYETFSSVINSSEEKEEPKQNGINITSGRKVPFDSNESVQFKEVPPNPTSFQWTTSWDDKNSQLVGNDASKLDLRNSGKLLSLSDFDNNTKFPAQDKLPDNYNPEQIFKNGKTPGLGIDKLHEQGYTGKGINIAIIDTPMSVDHQEFEDNKPNYFEIGALPNAKAEMHGMAVTSIVAGKNTGIAPGAHVDYYGAGQWDLKEQKYTTKYKVEALKQIEARNQTLSDDKKINVVSMSWAVPKDDPNYKEYQETIKKLEDKGVFVINCQEPYLHNYEFGGLRKTPGKDSNDSASYKIVLAVTDQIGEENYADKTQGNAILVPSERTLAGPSGKDNYVHYPEGGSSWQAPYVAGVYALAKQANPNLTPDEFRKKTLETGTPYYSPSGQLVGKIINPEKLIEDVSKK